jgi:subtilisin-like proprotein convertase family protein
MKQTLLSFFVVCLFALTAPAQTYYRNISATIPGNGGSLYDTLNVTNLNQSALTAAFGLDSVSIDNLQYNNDQDLVISLIAPDGTIVHLSDNVGGGGQNFVNTYFDMNVTNFVNDASAPFTGEMRPEMWLGMVNNGQIGNKKWILHILNTNTSNNTGKLFKWGLHFSTAAAAPAFFNTSTLPVVVINTNDVVIPFASDVKVFARMGVIDNGPGQLNYLTSPYNDYDGYISIKVRGNSTASFPTPSYTVETEDSAGDNNNVSLLGLPADNDWVLYAPWDDKSLIRDVLTYQLSNNMGDYASRTRLCQVMLNGDYRGVYVLEEKIKQGADRVNIHKLSASDTTGAKLTGGYIFQVDRADAPGYDSWFSVYPPCTGSTDQVAFVYVDPKDEDINTPQKNYIANYMDSFETELKTNSVYDTINGYRKYIDVPSFIDQSLLQEIGHNVDGYRLSTYFYKDKSGKLFGGPIWDFN